MNMSPVASSAAESRKTFARLCVVVAAVLWSTNGLFVKSQVFADWPPETRGAVLAFWRALFAGMLMVPAVRAAKWDWKLIPMALAFTAMNVTFLQSMTLTTAANAIWLQSTAPLWVYLMGRTLIREVRDPRDVVSLAFGLAGAGTILCFELRVHRLDSQAGIGALLGLVSGVFYACVVVSMRALRHQQGAFLVALNHLAAAALLAPYCWYLGQSVSGKQFMVLAAFGFFQMALPYLFFARALRDIPVQEAAAIGLLEPVLVPTWVFLATGEQPAAWTIVGGALILFGLAWRYRRA